MKGYRLESALVRLQAIVSGVLVVSLVSVICFPAAGLAVEGASGGGADEQKPVAAEIDPDDSGADMGASADTSDGDADGADDVPVGEDGAPQINPSFSMSMKRVTAAPADTDEFFIDPDGPALTWDEFAEKYLVDEGEDDDGDDEGEDEGDWEEDEDAAPDLEDNGWYLDIDEFRWYYCADDGEDYAEGSIPAAYRADAETDGLDFGRLHDSDFGGIWYFSKSDGRWHFVDCYGKDHAKPSPAFLEEQYNRFADEAESDDEGSDDEGDDDGDEDDGDVDDPDDDPDAEDDEGDADDTDSDDEGEDDEDADVAEWYWDEKYWEDRVVGYGFGQGDSIVYEVTIANTGDAAITMGLANAFSDTPTDPAVGGVYPLDGSGTHPAATMSASAEDDESDGDAIEEEKIVGEANAGVFADPVVDSVEGEGVTWNNEAESKGTTVMPEITVEPGSSAVICLTVNVSGNTAEVLAATPDSADCGYATTASSVDAAASVPAPAEADSSDGGDSSTTAGAAGSAAAQDGEEADMVAEGSSSAEAEDGSSGDEGSPTDEDSPDGTVEVADQSASAYAPTRATYYTDYLRNSVVMGKAATAKASAKGAKAWKAHRNHTATTKGTSATAMPKVGDFPVGIFAALALLACAALLACSFRARSLRR